MNFAPLKSRSTGSVLLVAALLVACGDKPEAMLLSAKSYLTKNDSKAAIIQIKNALQGNPNLSEARWLLGVALLESGDAVGAETELRKALELKHAPDVVVPSLAKALLAQGQVRKLVEEFATLELNQPAARASLLVSLAAAHAAQGKIELSQAALNAALLAEPGHAPALLGLAQHKAGQHDFAGALALADEVIAKAPGSHEAWKFKGDVFLYARKQVDEALVAYRKAVAAKPDWLQGHAAVTMLLLQQARLAEAEQQIAELKKFAALHPQTQLFEAQLAFQKKDFKMARERLQQVLKASPGNLQALQLAGAVELQLNSPLSAEGYLSKVVQAAPELAVARRLLVMTYLRTGQAAKAMATLLPGLKQKSVDPELLAVAGEVYLQNGDARTAEAYFEQAVRLAPQDGRKRTALAMTHLASGRLDVALAELQEIAASDAGATADLALISLHLKRRAYDQALQAIDGLEKKQPDKPLAAHLRARTLLAKRDMAGARTNFERALALDPSYFPAIASLAALDMGDKKPEAARKRFEAVLSREPNHGQAWLALAELAAKSGAEPGEVSTLIGKAVSANPEDLKARLWQIEFHMRQKDIKAAAAAAQNALAALPDSPEILDALGRVQLASGEFNQALATYGKLAGLQPMSPQPHLRLADVHMAEKNREAAAQSLRKGLEIKPDLLEAQRNLIALDMEDKRFAQALVTARTVQKQRPKEVVGYGLEGDIHAAQKSWGSAAAAYRLGLRQVNSSRLALKLHAVLLASDQGAEADKFSAAWQKDNPKDAAFLFYLGDSAMARKDYGTAEKHYAAVLKLQPNNAGVYNNLAWVSAKLNKADAIGYAEKANGLAPNQPAFMDTLAMVLSGQGEYAKALALQQKVLALQPKNAFYKLNLAKIHLQGGQKELARKELDELGKLGDKFPAQAEVVLLSKQL